MPRNVYFSHGTRNEKHLMEDILIEAMRIYGHDVYYIPRKIIELDKILNEDVLSKYEKAFKIEMYVENVDGFEGDGKLISKFGLEIRDQVTLVVSRRRWNQLIARFGYTEDSQRPREGDLIYFPMTAGMFEIKWVEDKLPFFQLNNTPTFKLTCELHEYTHTNIDTGVHEVDAVQNAMSQTNRAKVQFENDIPHRLNEYVTITLPSGVTGQAKFLTITQDEDLGGMVVGLGTLEFDDGQYHQLTVGTTLLGKDSGALGTVESLIGITSGDQLYFENDINAQNSSFETQGNSFLDFTESNPFGEPF